MEAKGQVVAQQDIITQVWGDIIVAPNALQRCIAQLRKAFDDDAKRQHIIKTYPKLGYSLIANVSEGAPVGNTPATGEVAQSKKPTSLARFGLAIVLLSVLIAAFFYFKQPQQTHYSQVTPLTSTDAQERATTLSPDGMTLAFIRLTSPEHQQIVLRDMVTGIEKVLLENAKAMGQLAFSTDGAMISFGQMSVNQGRKCTKLINLDVTNKQSKVAKDCINDFVHSPYWMDMTNLLAFRQPKNDNATIIRLNLIDKTEYQIKGIPFAVHRYAYDSINKMLALVTRHNGQWTLLFGHLSDDKFSLKQQWPLPFIDGVELLPDTFIPQWRDSKQLLLAGNNKIYEFGLDGNVDQATVLSNDQLFRAIPYKSQQLIVEMGRSDWDVSSFNWRDNKGEHRIISRSIFEELLGQFRPKHRSISVLSKRTGIAQIWLREQGEARQITDSDTSIVDYLWSPDGAGVVFLTDGKVFYQHPKYPVLKQLEIGGRVTKLFQWYLDESGQSQLLLEQMLDATLNVVSVNVEEGSKVIEIEGSHQWVQKIAEQQLIVSSLQGKLQLLKAGKRHDIESLKDTTLHWRFYLRDGAIYLQDKQFNVWQLNAQDYRARIVGKFDQKALLMTDISPSQHQMLSQHLVSENKEIMLLR